MIVIHGVHTVEEVAVLLFPHRQHFLFARHRPQIIYRRFCYRRHARDEHRAAIGLHTCGRTVLTENVHPAVQRRVLAVTHNDIAHSAALEFNHSHSRVLHLDIRVVEVLPDAVYFVHLAHVPQQQIQLMGRLVHQHAASLAFPRAAPGVAVIISLVAPTQHRHHSQHGTAQLPILDGLVDAHAGAVKTALHHRAYSDMITLLRRDDGVAVLKAGSQRLFHKHIAAAVRSRHGRTGMQWVRSTDAHHIQPRIAAHCGHIRIRLHTIA